MASASIVSNPVPTLPAPQGPVSETPVETAFPLGPNSTAVSIKLNAVAPFQAIRDLFDHLHAHPEDAAKLNGTYPRRGIVKTAARHNSSSDQKFTIDLSPTRNSLIPAALRDSLSAHGLDEILAFFNAVSAETTTMNFRLCYYNPDTAAPDCDNGCGAHTDYGTFTIIFQDGTPGLELEDADAPGTWVPVPGHATVILTGWCAYILSGGRLRAARHRVRRVPGVRRLSAVLFVAPDLDVNLKPLDGVTLARPFSDTVMRGDMTVEHFKEVMGKQWRYREGNEDLPDGDATATQDSEIERLVWG